MDDADVIDAELPRYLFRERPVRVAQHVSRCACQQNTTEPEGRAVNVLNIEPRLVEHALDELVERLGPHHAVGGDAALAVDIARQIKQRLFDVAALAAVASVATGANRQRLVDGEQRARRSRHRYEPSEAHRPQVRRHRGADITRAEQVVVRGPWGVYRDVARHRESAGRRVHLRDLDRGPAVLQVAAQEGRAGAE